jgi:type IV pilus assembly protein PilW
MKINSQQFLLRFWSPDWKRQSKQLGLSLVELMIALTLGLLLLGLVIQVFVSQRQTFSAGEALARVQENNRFVADLTREPARSLSLQGFCGGNARYLSHINLAAAAAPVLADPERVVAGWEYEGTGQEAEFTLSPDPTPGDGNWLTTADIGDLPEAVADRILPFSDALLIRELRLIPGRWPVGTDLNTATVTTNEDHGIPQCATVLLTNCARTDVFQNTSSSLDVLERGGAGCSPNNLAASQWQFFYADDTQIYQVIPRIYFVGRNPAGEPSFYRASYLGSGDPEIEELVEGVENLQVLYGYSAPAPAGDGQRVNRWFTADEVPNWELIISVRLDAIVRSETQLGGAATALQFEVGDGAIVTLPNDRLMRQPLSGTIALRNRMITQ